MNSIHFYLNWVRWQFSLIARADDRWLPLGVHCAIALSSKKTDN